MFKLVESINLEVPSSPSLVLRDLADYATLPFLAAFDFEPPSLSSDPSASRTKTMKRVTYIAVSKRAMPWLVELYLRFKDTAQIYADGTLEAVVAVRSFLDAVKFDALTSYRTGVLDPDQTQIRLPGAVQVRQGRTTVEDRHHQFHPDREQLCSKNQAAWRR